MLNALGDGMLEAKRLRDEDFGLYVKSGNGEGDYKNILPRPRGIFIAEISDDSITAGVATAATSYVAARAVYIEARPPTPSSRCAFLELGQ